MALGIAAEFLLSPNSRQKQPVMDLGNFLPIALFFIIIILNFYSNPGQNISHQVWII